ncbi:MAG: hypothetical protein O3A63_15620 [Proteobacteria bacterium]|nr:hypothetical protein [Pseudomonadota bacterium]
MWFEILFSYPLEVWRDGELLFANVTDPGWWIAACMILTLLTFASVLFGSRTRSLSLGKRLIIASAQTMVVLGVIGLLSNPVLKTTTMQPGVNTVAVMLDTSASMELTDAAEQQTRLESARDLIDSQLRPSLSAVAQTEMFEFARVPVRPNSSEPTSADADKTHLISSIRSVIDGLQGTPLAAVVVISDGADNEHGGRDIADLRARGIPVHTIGIGALHLEGETQLTDVKLPAEAPPNSQVVATVAIRHSSPGPAVLRVREGNRLLAMQPLDLPADRATVRTEIAFDSGSGGIRELNFELSAPEGDILEQNNHVERLLTVTQRRRSVLYLEGEPRWEYKFLQRALQIDDVIDLSLWLRTTDRKTYRQGPETATEFVDGFPASLAALFAFDLIILGSLPATSLTDAQHGWLEQFVADRGGSLLMLAGRNALDDGGWDASPLAHALPVTLDRERAPTYQVAEGVAVPTRNGRSSPITQFDVGEGHGGWPTLPPLADVQRLGDLKPAASVLLEHIGSTGTQPLLVTQPYGLGTTAILATSTTWRWQMRTPEDDPRHAQFWRQLIRALAVQAPQPRTLALTEQEGDIVLRAFGRDEQYRPISGLNATALLTRPDRTQSQITLTPGSIPGQLGARVTPGDPGVYRLDVTMEGAGSIETITRFIRTGVANQEYFEPTQNQALLQRLSEATGGSYWQPAQVAEIANAITYRSSGIRSTTHLPLWSAPVFFLLLLVLKAADWSLRRWWGRI